MSEHARYSPSSFDRVIECPGSLRESEGMPNRSSSFAEEGTRAHEMAADILQDRLVDIAAWSDVTDPAAMLDHVMVYTDHVLDLAPKEDDVILVEQKVKMDDEVWGTSDAVVWSPSTETLHIRDLKFGAGIAVEVDGNTQLKMYALMTLLTLKYPAKFVTAGIVQPRCFHTSGPIRVTQPFLAIELLDFWSDVRLAIEVSKQPQAALRAGSHCRFCPAAPKCPEMKRGALQAAKLAFAPAIAYSPDELSKALDWAPTLEAWIKNVREFAYSEAEQGRTPPGYKLVDKLAVRKWREDISPTDLAAQLACGLDELYAPKEMLGVTAIEKLAPGKNAKERAAVLAPFVTKVSTGHALAPEGDKRIAVRLDAKAAFALAPPVVEQTLLTTEI